MTASHSAVTSTGRARRRYREIELEATVKRFIRMVGEFVAQYDIDDTQDWDISSYTGIVYYYSGSSS